MLSNSRYAGVNPEEEVGTTGLKIALKLWVKLYIDELMNNLVKRMYS